MDLMSDAIDPAATLGVGRASVYRALADNAAAG